MLGQVVKEVLFGQNKKAQRVAKAQFCLFFGLILFFGGFCFEGFKGQVRSSLGPKPSLFVFCFVFWRV